MTDTNMTISKALKAVKAEIDNTTWHGWVLKDRTTGEVVDSNGRWGYRTKEKAFAAYWWKLKQRMGKAANEQATANA